MPERYPKFISAAGLRKVLVVEDEWINRELLGMMLQETYHAVFAETGKAAMDILETQCETLSIVLLDLHLPDMEGIQILRRIKDDIRTARIPVIVLTADQDAEVECLSLGATDFIPKPYPKQEVVLARIQRTIEFFEDRDILYWTERDHLTGLYNLEFFLRYAVQLEAYYKESPSDAIVVDINHFHMINERYGREAGNEVLKNTAKILQEAVHESEGIVCRRGSDTFLLYCRHRDDYEELLDRVSSRINNGFQVRVRMGVYPEVDRTVEIERCFDRAKQAADKVKSSFSGAVGIYDKSMFEKELYNEQLLEDFHKALEEKQFTVFYQPKFNIRGEKPVLSSAEALVRWNHPELGMVSPAAFIPLFEENGLIRELDSFVWREAAVQIQTWKSSMDKVIPISVNVSRVDLTDPSLLEILTGIARETGIEMGDLRLEITESAYTEDSDDIIRIVKRLRESEFPIEMDDFGTGYSSLNMLTALPIDALKLDMQFLRTAFSDITDTRLLDAVFALARSLGLPTIAEGVETAEQLATLKAMGCDVVQGYYFSKPLSAEDFEHYIRELET